MSGPDGIYLYTNGRRIGGPYKTEEEATRESIRVSTEVDKGPIEDYETSLRAGPGLLDEGSMDLDFETDMPEFKVPSNPDYGLYPADMRNVKFFRELPSRFLIEGKLIEAGKISGVTPMFTEGFRTEEQNRLVGGHPNSYHMKGLAFDVKVSGNRARDLVYLKELRRLFPEFKVVNKLKHNHIHFQIRD
jgi:hypothetical protein